jgi:hypothetical protein
MKTFKIITLGSVLIILSAQNLSAQTANGGESRKVQVTFAYPVGSAGINSRNYTNNFSFNILYGLNGGVNGFELGSLWNHNVGDVKGFQLSGLMNSTAGNSLGFLISGVANWNKKAVSGAAISGVLNLSNQSLGGFQLAGVSNIASDSLNGISISGVLNYTNGNAKGFQLSTINLAKHFEGVQVGVLNYTEKLKGVQLGVINIIKEGENGLPIGLLNFVKNGYYEFDLTAGEAIYSNLNYKMGVKRLYTIFKLGYSRYQGKPVYSFGGGFGTSIFLSEKHRLNLELSSNQIYFNNNWDSQSNGLNKLDVNYKFYILDKLSLLIGPSFNTYITEMKINGEYGTINIPYTVYEHEYAGKKLFMWIGLNVGVSLKL